MASPQPKHPASSESRVFPAVTDSHSLPAIFTAPRHSKSKPSPSQKCHAQTTLCWWALLLLSLAVWGLSLGVTCYRYYILGPNRFLYIKWPIRSATLTDFAKWLPAFSSLRIETFLFGLFAILTNGLILYFWRHKIKNTLVVFDEFSLNWNPEKQENYLFEQSELQQSILYHCAEKSIVYLSGKSGVGKSLCANKIFNYLNAFPEQTEINWIPIHVNMANAISSPEGRDVIPADSLWDAELNYTLKLACATNQSCTARWQDILIERTNQARRGGRPVRVLLILDQLDDYMTFYDNKFWKKSKDKHGHRELISASELMGLSATWKDIANILRFGLPSGTCCALAIYRSDVGSQVSCFAFDALSVSYLRVDEIPSQWVNRKLLDKLTQGIYQNNGQEFSRHPFLRKIVNDINRLGEVLPVRIQHWLLGIKKLPQLTVSTYERMGALYGLETLALREQISECLRQLADDEFRISLEEAQHVLVRLAEHNGDPLSESDVSEHIHAQWQMKMRVSDYKILMNKLFAKYQNERLITKTNNGLKLYHDYLSVSIQKLKQQDDLLSQSDLVRHVGQQIWEVIFSMLFLRWKQTDLKRLWRYAKIGMNRAFPDSGMKRVIQILVAVCLLKVSVMVYLGITLSTELSKHQRLAEYLRNAQLNTVNLAQISSEPQDMQLAYIKGLSEIPGPHWAWVRSLVAVTGFRSEKRQTIFQEALGLAGCTNILIKGFGQIPSVSAEGRLDTCQKMAYSLSVPISALEKEYHLNPMWRSELYSCTWKSFGADGAALERRLDSGVAESILEWMTGKSAEPTWNSNLADDALGFGYDYMNDCRPRSRLMMYKIWARHVDRIQLAEPAQFFWNVLRDTSAPINTSYLESDERLALQTELERVRSELLGKLIPRLSDAELQKVLGQALGEIKISGSERPYGVGVLSRFAGAAAVVPLLLDRKRVPPDRIQEIARKLYANALEDVEGTSAASQYFKALLAVMSEPTHRLVVGDLMGRKPTLSTSTDQVTTWRTALQTALAHAPPELAWEFAQNLFLELEAFWPADKARPDYPQPLFKAWCSLLADSAARLAPAQREAFLKRWWELYSRLVERMSKETHATYDYPVLSSLSEVLTVGVTQLRRLTSPNGTPPEELRTVHPNWPLRAVAPPTKILAFLQRVRAQLAMARPQGEWSYIASSLPSDLLPFLPAKDQLSFFQQEVYGKAVRARAQSSNWGTAAWNTLTSGLCETEVGQQHLRSLAFDEGGQTPASRISEVFHFLSSLAIQKTCPQDRALPLARELVEALAGWLEQLDESDVLRWQRQFYLPSSLPALAALMRMGGVGKGDAQWPLRLWRLQKKLLLAEQVRIRQDLFGQPAPQLNNALHINTDWTPLWRALSETRGDAELGQLVDQLLKAPPGADAGRLGGDAELVHQGGIIQILAAIQNNRQPVPLAARFCENYLDDLSWSGPQSRGCIPYLSSDAKEAALLALFCAERPRQCGASDMQRRRWLRSVAMYDTLRLIPLLPEESSQLTSKWMQRWLDLVRAPTVGEALRQVVIQRIEKIVDSYHGKQGYFAQEGLADPWRLIPWARARGFDVESVLE